LISIDKLYIQKYYQRAARVRRFTTKFRYAEMKYFVRLSVLTALAFGASLPAFCAPSDSDMGFASQREPTAGDAGNRGQVQGTRASSTAGGIFAGADNGAATGNTTQLNKQDSMWYDTQDRSRFLIQDTPYQANPGQQSRTHQHAFQQLTNGEKGSTLTHINLLSPMSVGGAQFKGPQTLGFKGSGALTPYALRRGIITRATGTGSVNASITSANGKD
jgi:hypothetical protein